LPILDVRKQWIAFERGAMAGKLERIACPERRLCTEERVVRAQNAHYGRLARGGLSGNGGRCEHAESRSGTSCYIAKMLRNHRERIIPLELSSGALEWILTA
jgi:hypothetical protein